MNLILSITKSPPGVSLSQTQQVFDEQGGDIGRADRNTWVLADPDRYISSTHCRIEFENGCFFLVDKSTNGTFLNHSDQPIGKDQRVALADGMMFSVGDYEFAIKVADQAAMPGMNAAFPGAVGPFDAPAAPPAQAMRRETRDDFDMDIPLASDQELYQPVHITPHHESVIPGQENVLDPLRLLDQVQNRNKPDMIPDAPRSNFSNSSLQRSSVTDEAFTPPKLKHNETIPEDWDNTEYGYKQNQKLPRSANSANAQRSNKRQSSSADHFELMRDDSADSGMVANRAPAGRGKQASGKQAAVKPRTSHPQSAQRNAAVNAPSAAEIQRAAQAVNNDLLAAMGLDKSNFNQEQLAQLNYIIGQFVRHTVEGLLKVLRARSTIKNELRLGVTTVQPRDNNPIKFSADVDDALEPLFVRQSKAYLPPIASVNESFETILDHQVAVLAGMRAAFSSLIQKFDPVQLAAKFETQAGSGLFSGGKKVKHWESYNDFYNAQVQDLDSSFQHLFGEEFVKAYESQLVQLSIARRQEKNKE